jgi:hypothetical protein
MKRIFGKVPEWFLLPVMGVLFLMSWPFILIWSWIGALFSGKMSDRNKVEITKEIVIILGGLILILAIYSIFGWPE